MYQIKAHTPKGIKQIHPCIVDLAEAERLCWEITSIKQQHGTILGECWIEEISA